MAHSSLQVCMDSSDWLHQGTMTMSEELSTGLDSSSPSPSGGGGTTTECMLAAACSSRAGPPLMERRLRPPHDQHLKCPRCDSTHTKFCYYNNYSLSQPRYFCKTCRRYWTKGGTLRNIPVGGGCRKNKKPTSSKKSNNNNNTTTSGGDPLNHHINHQSPIMMMPNHLGSPSSTSNNHPIDLHLSFPHEVQFPPHLAHLIGAQMSLGGVIGGAGGGGGGGSFMGLEGGGLIRPIDFMESKYEGLMGGVSRGHDFMGSNGNGNGNGNNGNNNNNENDQFGLMGGIDGGCYNNGTSIGGGINYSSDSLFGVPTNTNATTSHDISFMDQRLLLPYDHLNNDHHHHNHDHDHHHHHHHHHQSGLVDVKPNPKLLSLEWQDQGCTTTTTTTPTTNTISDHHNSGSNALNSWTGFLGSFQSPTTNPLV